MNDEFPSILIDENEFPQLIGERIAVASEITEESGQFVVYLEIVTAFETYKHRINAYSTRRKAEIAADLMRRCADRDITAPPDGF